MGNVLPRRSAWAQEHRVPLVLAAMLLMAMGIPLWLATETGSISIPHNDAWSYSEISQNFAHSGHIHLLGWNRGALIGQVVLVGPLGRWFAAQQLVIVGLGLAAAVLTYRLAAARAGQSGGLLGAALVMFFPGYALLSTSFMEDIPAYFAMVACLLLGERALRDESRAAFGAALLVGAWGFTVREQTIAAPLAVFAAIAWRQRRSRAARWHIAVACVVFLALFAAFELWRGSMPYADQGSVHFAGPTSFILKSFRAYYTLALVVSPAVLASIRRRGPFTRGQWLCCAAIGLCETVVILAFSHARGFLGGSLTALGSYSAEHNGHRTVLPSPLIQSLEVVALVSGALLPVLVVKGWRRLGPILTTFGLLTVAGTLFEIEVGQSVFDRYLIALVPLVVITCGPIDHVTARVRAGVGTAVLGCLSLALAASALTIDAAEWHAGQDLLRAGLPATSIDAGFDWFGYHADTPANQRRRTADPSEPFYLSLFPKSRGCVAVSVARPGSGTVLATVEYRTFGIAGTSRLYVTDTGRCGIPSAVSARIRDVH